MIYGVVDTSCLRKLTEQNKPTNSNEQHKFTKSTRSMFPTEAKPETKEAGKLSSMQNQKPLFSMPNQRPETKEVELFDTIS